MYKPTTDEILDKAAKAFQQGKEEFETANNKWWDSLSEEDKLNAFYAVTKRIHQGEIKEQGSYRWVLYDVFGFGTEAYVLGMNSGYMDIHNAIDPDANNTIDEEDNN